MHRLERLGVWIINSTEEGVVVINAYEASLLSQIKGEKDQDPILLELKEKVHKQWNLWLLNKGEMVFWARWLSHLESLTIEGVMRFNLRG